MSKLLASGKLQATWPGTPWAPRRLAHGAFFVALASVCLLALGGCSPSNSSNVDPALKRFAENKKACTRAWAQEQKLSIPHAAWSFFDATSAGRWEDATNAYAALPGVSRFGGPSPKPTWGQVAKDKFTGLLAKFGYKPKPPKYLQTEVRVPLNETYGALTQFRAWDNHLLHFYGETIIGSIPTNSIYFGGTDAGRFIISALCESQQEGRPFFTLTQNALADGTYTTSLQKLYGSKLAIPGADSMQKAFSTYVTEAQRRAAAGRPKLGESVVQSQNRITVSGQTAVMEINGLLVRDIFDQNPDREFYVEESWPLDWMYPYLSPHGPLLKLNRQPLPELPESVVLQDREYWKRLTAELLGDTMNAETSITNTCDFVRRVYVTKHLTGFKGNARYVRDAAAQEGFSSLRKAIAGIYAWRADQAQSTEEGARLQLEAELAYRQAFMLGPGSSEVVERFVNRLLSANRQAEAVEVLRLSVAVNPGNPKVAALFKSLTEK